MNGITDIQIKGYRGIRSLQLSQLRRVNLLLGNNNCGKSSVLEAILTMLVPTNPIIPMITNTYRNYNGFNKKDVALLFHNLDVESPILLEGTQETNGDKFDRKVNIKYFESGKVTDVALEDLHNKVAGPISRYGLLYTYNIGERDYRSIVSFLNDGSSDKGKFSQTSDQKHEEARIRVDYIPAGYDIDRFIVKFNKIITNKEKEKVLDILRHLEPRITDLTVVGDTVMADVGLKRLIPINVLGDGFRKLFTIIIAMYDVKGGVLIIDEIDNGLYYKSMLTLWNTLLKSSAYFDVQVFATTHSKDSINALKSVLTDEMNECRNDVKMITLRKRPDDEVRAFAYEYEQFSHVLNQDLEIR